jgi:hypothetical protein
MFEILLNSLEQITRFSDEEMCIPDHNPRMGMIDMSC